MYNFIFASRSLGKGSVEMLELDSQPSLGKGSSSHPLLYNIGLVLGSILGINQSVLSIPFNSFTY